VVCALPMDRIATHYFVSLRVTERATSNPRCGVSHVGVEL